jgi:hypothetical protein
MQPGPSETNVIRRVGQGTHKKVIDIFGPTVEFLTSPEDARGDFCVMRGVIPPGVSVPLHSHDETESFFVISGTKQVLMPGPRGLEWDRSARGRLRPGTARRPARSPECHRRALDRTRHHDRATGAMVPGSRDAPDGRAPAADPRGPCTPHRRVGQVRLLARVSRGKQRRGNLPARTCGRRRRQQVTFEGWPGPVRSCPSSSTPGPAGCGEAPAARWGCSRQVLLTPSGLGYWRWPRRM